MQLRDLLIERYQSGPGTPTGRTTLLDAALDYLRKGWSVIPLKGKRPTIVWSTFQNVRPDESQIRAWFSISKLTGIGIVTGRISNMFVLDVDPKKGGQESLGRLQMKCGTLPDTLRVRTGGGGQHFYFCMPQGIEIRNAADLQGYPGLDIRGNGGYVAAPPSKHPSGKRYRWDTSGAEDPAEAPQWLIDLVGADHPQAGVRQSDTSYPPAKIGPIVEGCGFIRHCRDDAGTLTEPPWYMMLSVVGRCEGGEKLAHEWSVSYPSYDPDETTEKLKHALSSPGPPTCSYISRNGGRETCLKCLHRGRIKSPIVLGSAGGGGAGADFIDIVVRRTDTGNGRALVKR